MKMLLPNTNSFLLKRKRHVTSRLSSQSEKVAVHALVRAVFHEQTTSNSSKGLRQTTESKRIFLPNTNSFLLERKRNVTPRLSSQSEKIAERAVFHEQTTNNPSKSLRQTAESDKIFLPSTDSFVLTRQTYITRPTVSLPIFLPHSHSFLLTLPSAQSIGPSPDSTYTEESDLQSEQSADSEQIIVDDHKKRTFLKIAGVAGAGLAASQLFPKKASALILGSSPTTGIVGVKNDSNTRINPATEETVDSILKTTDLDFDGSGYLNVNVAAGGGGASSFSDSGDVSKLGLVDADRHVQVDVLSSTLPSSASTESTLQTISFGGVQYALQMVTSGNYDYIGEASIGSTTSASSWRVKRVDNTSGNVAILWADTGTFNQVWDNYASLSYS
jgi:hypothetical protein